MVFYQLPIKKLQRDPKGIIYILHAFERELASCTLAGSQNFPTFVVHTVKSNGFLSFFFLFSFNTVCTIVDKLLQYFNTLQLFNHSSEANKMGVNLFLKT